LNARQIHNLTASEALSALASSARGLTPDEAAKRLRDRGPNVLSLPPALGWLRALLRQFTNLFSLLLDLSAVLCFVADHMQPGEGMAVLGFALLVVAVLNALFTFAQELRAERAMAALAKLLPLEIRVRRAGVEQRIPVADVVVGDVVMLGEGDRIPADCRVVDARSLLVNNAPLTGESRHTNVTAEAVVGGRLIDASNVAFAGCLVLRGSADAVVFATGRGTEFGKIAALSVEVRRPPTPLEREVTRTVRVVTTIAVSLGLLFFGYGLLSGRPLWTNVVFMLGIIVANVPEGLLPTLTLSLALGGLRLAKKKVLVKSLNAVEALGAVEVICTDKTGTLTRNDLVVTAAVAATTGRELAHDARRELLEAAVGASEVHRSPTGLTGDPLDVAAARALEALGGDPLELAGRIVHHLPFDVERRRAASVVVSGTNRRFHIKGAWEVVRAHVSHVVSAEGLRVATDDVFAACEATVHELASRGLRVIAVSSRELDVTELSAPEPDLEHGLTLLGFLCLEDPLRPEVPEAVRRCRTAGVRVLLITGDHPDTARSIAVQAGIIDASADRSAVLTGDALESEHELGLVARIEAGARVFARTTPEQKLKIVRAVKHMGLLVAMTGDGVNDAPALRAADVGIAMGVSGTDVAREAAQIVLLDDNFASIVAGVEEGRAVFSNVQKFTSYVLSSNVPEIVPFLAYVVLPVPLALTVIQILCIDLGTDMIPAIGLGQEPPDGEAMARPPRGAHGRLLSRALLLRSYLFLGAIQAVWAMAMFFAVLVAGGWHFGQLPPAESPLYRGATGITLISVIFVQIANLVGRRFEQRWGLDAAFFKNPFFVVGVSAELVFGWAALYFPPLADSIGTGPVDARWVLFAALGGPLFFALDLARKRTRMRRGSVHA